MRLFGNQIRWAVGVLKGREPDFDAKVLRGLEQVKRGESVPFEEVFPPCYHNWVQEEEIMRCTVCEAEVKKDG